MSTQPKVSVCMLAYNHEKYVRQAVESVLMQKVDFPYEIVIGEDCSTDQTAEILRDLAKKNPDVIRLRCNKKNLGMQKNGLMTLNECCCEYIACLEADDYWTDDLKLQKQIDFLESHPEYSACFHNGKIVAISGEVIREQYRPSPHAKTVCGFGDLARRNFVLTASIIYRRSMVLPLPEWIRLHPVGDWPMHLIASLRGPIRYLPEVMSAYRMGGTFSSQNSFARVKIVDEGYSVMINNFDLEQSNILKKARRWNRRKTGCDFYRRGYQAILMHDGRLAASYLREAFRWYPALLGRFLRDKDLFHNMKTIFFFRSNNREVNR